MTNTQHTEGYRPKTELTLKQKFGLLVSTVGATALLTACGGNGEYTADDMATAVAHAEFTGRATAVAELNPEITRLKEEAAFLRGRVHEMETVIAPLLENISANNAALLASIDSFTLNLPDSDFLDTLCMGDALCIQYGDEAIEMAAGFRAGILGGFPEADCQELYRRYLAAMTKFADRMVAVATEKESFCETCQCETPCEHTKTPVAPSATPDKTRTPTTTATITKTPTPTPTQPGVVFTPSVPPVTVTRTPVTHLSPTPTTPGQPSATPTTQVEVTPTRTATSVLPSRTPTVLVSNTPRPSETATVPPTATTRPSETPTVPASNTPRPSETPTVPASNTPRPSETPTVPASNTPRPSETATPGVTVTRTLIPENPTPTWTPTNNPIPGTPEPAPSPSSVPTVETGTTPAPPGPTASPTSDIPGLQQ